MVEKWFAAEAQRSMIEQVSLGIDQSRINSPEEENMSFFEDEDDESDLIDINTFLEKGYEFIETEKEDGELDKVAKEIDEDYKSLLQEQEQKRNHRGDNL